MLRERLEQIKWDDKDGNTRYKTEILGDKYDICLGAKIREFGR